VLLWRSSSRAAGDLNVITPIIGATLTGWRSSSRAAGDLNGNRHMHVTASVAVAVLFEGRR